MKKLGLIGKSLEHSFSKNYFSEKFQKAKMEDWQYDLYPIDHIDVLPQLLAQNPNLKGLNITNPYKEAALKYVHVLNEDAAKIGAINTLKFLANGEIKGYNTDIIGFENSLAPFIVDARKPLNALILGTGGASKAVHFVLNKLNIPSTSISRNPEKGLPYIELDNNIMKSHRLIINCTPLGTYPNVEQAPEIPYDFLTSDHYLYDLVYNPEKTLFLQHGIHKGAQTKNGLDMLAMQAEASWEIWNKG